MLDKRRFTTALAKYGVNPAARLAVRLGLARRSTAILETTGRKSGEPRRNPVTNGLEGGDTFWVVSEHGRRAAYVRNLEANPRVRVNVGGHWRAGTARLVPDDDPRARLRAIARNGLGPRLNTATVRLMGTDLLSVRIDLDTPPSEAPVASATTREALEDGLRAGLVAAILSGVPSTLYALAVGGRPLEASLAAGSMVLPRERRAGRLLAAAVPVHFTLSLGWAAVLAVSLPRRHTPLAGAAAGLTIAALDLGLAGRRFPCIQALPRLPQVADHVAFGVVTAVVVERRRRARGA